MVNIGEEKREFVGLNTDGPLHTQILLGGSKENSLTLDLLSPKMGCIPMTGKLFRGYDYDGPAHKLKPFKEPWFSTGNLMISLDEEQAFIDHEGGFITVPRVGRRMQFEERDRNGKVPTLVHQSNEYGTIVYDIQEERAEGYSIASNSMTSIIYRDEANDKGHPDIVVMRQAANVTKTQGENKALALQLGDTFRLFNKTTCFNTHLSSIKACYPFWPPAGMRRDNEILDTLGSQYHLFMQL